MANTDMEKARATFMCSVCGWRNDSMVRCEHFTAALTAAREDEREACARVADAFAAVNKAYAIIPTEIAEKIRARKG
jgi:hypothetical protein